MVEWARFTTYALALAEGHDIVQDRRTRRTGAGTLRYAVTVQDHAGARPIRRTDT